jgi:hypothetical protein
MLLCGSSSAISAAGRNLSWPEAAASSVRRPGHQERLRRVRRHLRIEIRQQQPH